MIHSLHQNSVILKIGFLFMAHISNSPCPHFPSFEPTTKNIFHKYLLLTCRRCILKADYMIIIEYTNRGIFW